MRPGRGCGRPVARLPGRGYNSMAAPPSTMEGVADGDGEVGVSPPAGEPGAVAAGARSMAAAAGALGQVGDRLRGATLFVVVAGAWRGPASEAFLVDSAGLQAGLDRAADALGQAAGVMAELAARLEQAQASWDRARRLAVSAGAELDAGGGLVLPGRRPGRRPAVRGRPGRPPGRRRPPRCGRGPPVRHRPPRPRRLPGPVAAPTRWGRGGRRSGPPFRACRHRAWRRTGGRA
jgi:uncharacterized protein YukE